MNSKLVTFLKFGAVGAINLGIDACAFLMLTASGTPIVIAQVCAYGLGTLNSYLMNGKWTFKSKRLGNAGTLLRFLAVNLLTVGITSALLIALHIGMHLSLPISKIIVIVFGLLLNYSGCRFWVFRFGQLYQRSET